MTNHTLKSLQIFCMQALTYYLKESKKYFEHLIENFERKTNYVATAYCTKTCEVEIRFIL